MIRLLPRLAAHICDGTCDSAVRLAIRVTRAESRAIDLKEAEERAHEAAQREWQHRHDSLLAAKRDLERQLNVEREKVALLEAEGLG